MTRRKTKKTPIGPRLIASLKEVLAGLESGEPLEKVFTVRTVEVAEPGNYDAKRIRSLRTRLGASQAIFAKLLGVSVELLQNWEQSLSQPRPIARRLLDEISRDPEAYAARTMKRQTMAA